MTGRELSERVRLEPPEYYAIEQGYRLPSKDELRRLAAALDASESALYSDEERARMPDVTEKPKRGEPGYSAGSNVSAYFEILRGPERLFVSPDELTWSERKPNPGHPVDVYLSMSCGTQQNPNLLLDTVAVFDALGVNFAAAAGPSGCCGGPVWGLGLGSHWAAAKVSKIQKFGATTNVNWCTNCQVRLTTEAERRETADGVAHPIREVQVLSFLAERLQELGDRVPWQKEVRRKVVAEGHWAWTDIHRTAQVATTRILSMIPGVEVIGLYDGHRPESPCAYRGRNMEGRAAEGEPIAPPRTREEARERRSLITRTIHEMGADTVACQHQGCHLLWCYYASDELSVMHGVSLLAEALGVRHPDRFQAAARLGDPELVLAQTRPMWQAWGMPEKRARDLAYEFSDPKLADDSTCACGGEKCEERVISIDALATPRSAAPTAARPN
jgi:transcriptional regulator with XRE-family HTH domain